MKKITLKNVTGEEVQVIQNELYIFQQCETSIFKQPHREMKFLESIMTIDIAFRLWYLFRTKIEATMPAKGFMISLRASEAAVLLKCCNFENRNRSPFEANVMEKYKLALDQQLKSL